MKNLKLKEKDIKLKRPNNKYMKAYLEAVKKGNFELREKAQRYR